METSLGAKIRSIRKSKKMTQSELAGSGLSRTMLSKLENDLAQPSFSTIEYLANRLDVPVSTFVSDETVSENKSDEKTLNYIQSLANENDFDNICTFMEDYLKNRDIKDDKIGGRLLLYYGMSCLNIGKIDEAFQILSEAVGILEKNYDPYYLALSNYQLSLYHYDRGNIEMDGHHAYEALQHLASSPIEDTLLEIRLLYNYAFIHVTSGESERAISILRQAIQIQQNNELQYMTGKIHMLLGAAHNRLEEYHKSIEHVKEAIRYFVYTNNKELHYGALHNLALYNMDIGNFSLSLNILKVCYDYYRSQNNKKRESEFIVELSLCSFLHESDEKLEFNLKSVIPEMLSDNDRQIYKFLEAYDLYREHSYDDALKLLLTVDAGHSKPLRVAISKLESECYSESGDYKTAFEILKTQESF